MKNTLKFLWLELLLIISVFFAELYRTQNLTRVFLYSYLLIFVLGIIVWIILAWRFIVFKKKLVIFLRHLLANDYESGVRVNPAVSDELTLVEKLINKASDQLRVYDNLRKDKIGFLNKTVSIITLNVKEGIIVADLEKRVFRLNTATQYLFGIEQEAISFDSLENLDDNKAFMELFKSCIDKERVTKEAQVCLQLPIRNTLRKVCVKIFPVKDNDEKVGNAIIFVSKAD